MLVTKSKIFTDFLFSVIGSQDEGLHILNSYKEEVASCKCRL